MLGSLQKKGWALHSQSNNYKTVKMFNDNTVQAPIRDPLSVFIQRCDILVTHLRLILIRICMDTLLIEFFFQDYKRLLSNRPICCLIGAFPVRIQSRVTPNAVHGCIPLVLRIMQFANKLKQRYSGSVETVKMILQKRTLVRDIDHKLNNGTAFLTLNLKGMEDGHGPSIQSIHVTTKKNINKLYSPRTGRFIPKITIQDSHLRPYYSNEYTFNTFTSVKSQLKAHGNFSSNSATLYCCS